MDDLPIYEEIIRLKKCRIPAALATVVETNGSAPRKAGAKMLVRKDGTIAGTIGGGQTEADTISAAMEVIRLGKPCTISFSLNEQNGAVCGGDMVVYLEPLVVPQHLVIVGGGHVGRAVTQAAHQAGFLVTLINTMQTKESAPMAEDVLYRPVQDLAAAFAEIGVDDGSYIFIATSDHQQDFLATAAALHTDARYISVLGSTRKRAAMENYLGAQGITGETISRVISPAGIEIGAETPAEIAVSVVAQMIRVRRSDNAEHLSHPACSRTIKKDGAQQAYAAPGS